MEGKKTEHIVWEKLTFKLTTEDIAEKGKLAAATAQVLGEKSRQFESLKKRAKGEIETLECEIASILDVIKEGEEEREVECIKMMDYDKNEVHYVYKGEIMKTRSMHDWERQTELPIPKDAVQPQGVDKSQEKDVMKRHLTGLSGAGTTPKDKDIADVMRAESNKKTKVDLVQ